LGSHDRDGAVKATLLTGDTGDTGFKTKSGGYGVLAEEDHGGVALMRRTLKVHFSLDLVSL